MVSPLASEYLAKTRRSRKLSERFRSVFAGGETRSTLFYRPYPIVIVAGSGARIVDADNNEYLDVLNNYTSLVHGHTFAPVVEVVKAALESVGSSHAAPNLAQLELGELLNKRFPAAERVRFTNSGTEATLLAIRIARAATGRRLVIGFDGGYHGAVAGFIDGDFETLRVPYNDVERLRSITSDSVAAIFVEPFLGSGGVIPAEAGFLRATSEIASDCGALMVLDEVQSLRNAFHGAHGELSLAPDLVTMGKVIGGGLPIGAVAGSAGLMALASAADGGPIMHPGTFNGNVPTMVGGLATMHELDAIAIARMNEAAARLAAKIEAAGERLGIPTLVTYSGSIMQVHFASASGELPESASAVRSERLAQLHLALLLQGVYAAPRGMLNLSTQMSDKDHEFIVACYEQAFTRLKDLRWG